MNKLRKYFVFLIFILFFFSCKSNEKKYAKVVIDPRAYIILGKWTQIAPERFKGNTYTFGNQNYIYEFKNKTALGQRFGALWSLQNNKFQLQNYLTINGSQNWNEYTIISITPKKFVFRSTGVNKYDKVLVRD